MEFSRIGQKVLFHYRMKSDYSNTIRVAGWVIGFNFEMNMFVVRLCDGKSEMGWTWLEVPQSHPPTFIMEQSNLGEGTLYRYVHEDEIQAIAATPHSITLSNEDLINFLRCKVGSQKEGITVWGSKVAKKGPKK